MSCSPAINRVFEEKQIPGLNWAILNSFKLIRHLKYSHVLPKKHKEQNASWFVLWLRAQVWRLSKITLTQGLCKPYLCNTNWNFLGTFSCGLLWNKRTDVRDSLIEKYNLMKFVSIFNYFNGPNIEKILLLTMKCSTVKGNVAE